MTEPDATIEAKLEDRGKFSGVLRHSNGAEVEVRGRWDQAEGRGHTEQAVHLRSFNPAMHNGRKFKFSDWALEPITGRWVSGRIEEWNPDGRLFRVLVWQSASRFTDDEFEALTADPVAGTPDPFRGDVHVKRTIDHRPSTPMVTKHESDGSTTTQPMAQSPESRSRGWLRTAGWVSAGGLVLALVAVRIVRAGRA
jgi:hypothetical protein